MYMYKSRYSKYVTKNNSRFAEPEEIKNKIPYFDPDGEKTCSGVPIFYEDGKLYIDNSDNHTIVVGPTGCKKTRVTAFTTLSTVIEARESAIVNDPKGEIYARTAGRAKELGLDVKVLNFRDTSKTDCWNPMMMPYKYHIGGRENDAVECINDFVDAIVMPALSNTNDRYWVDTSRVFLTALVMILLDSVPKEYFNLSNLIQLSYQSGFDKLSRILSMMDQKTTAAYGLHTVLDLNAEKTVSCIYSSMLSMLSPFIQNEGLLNMLCENTIDLENLGRKPTIIYLIYPDEKGTLNFLVNSFLTQSYETVINSTYSTGMTCPVRVNYILDEFSNLPPVHYFENRISEARSRNVRYFLFVQSYSQLKRKYAENAETILSNCSNWLCFSSREMEFLSKISTLCGREVDYNGIEHDLISPNEMQHLEKRDDGADVLVLSSGLYPFVSRLPDFDTLEYFADYPAASLSSVRIRPKARYFTFPEWYRGVMDNEVFRIPYPAEKHKKNIFPRSMKEYKAMMMDSYDTEDEEEDDDEETELLKLSEELEQKLEELFGSGGDEDPDAGDTEDTDEE